MEEVKNIIIIGGLPIGAIFAICSGYVRVPKTLTPNNKKIFLVYSVVTFLSVVSAGAQICLSYLQSQNPSFYLAATAFIGVLVFYFLFLERLGRRCALVVQYRAQEQV